jgi:hypothetical protein
MTQWDFNQASPMNVLDCRSRLNRCIFDFTGAGARAILALVRSPVVHCVAKNQAHTPASVSNVHAHFMFASP